MPPRIPLLAGESGVGERRGQSDGRSKRGGERPRKEKAPATIVTALMPSKPIGADAKMWVLIRKPVHPALPVRKRGGYENVATGYENVATA